MNDVDLSRCTICRFGGFGPDDLDSAGVCNDCLAEAEEEYDDDNEQPLCADCQQVTVLDFGLRCYRCTWQHQWTPAQKAEYDRGYPVNEDVAIDQAYEDLLAKQDADYGPTTGQYWGLY